MSWLDVIFSLMGLGLVFFGITRLRKKRLMEDTPTSTIRGVAMGMAELVGKAEERSPLTSGLTNVRCVWFRFTVEEERRGSKGERHWVKVGEGTSTDLFYLNDGTGRLVVDPMEAEMQIDFKRRWYDSGIDSFGFSTSLRRRYTEWLIMPTGKLYIFGFVRNTRDASAERRERLTQILRDLKADREKLMAFDADGDGKISAEEWDRAVEHAQRQLAEEDLADPNAGSGMDADGMVVCRGPQEKTYIISDTGEKGAVRKYAITGYLCVFGGTILFLFGLESLLVRLGVINGGLVIPWGGIMRYGYRVY